MLFLGNFLTVTTALTAAEGQPGFTTDLFVPGSPAIFFVILILCLFLI